jgi:hypothetical protein
MVREETPEARKLAADRAEIQIGGASGSFTTVK